MIAVRAGHGVALASVGLALTAVAAFVVGTQDVHTDATKTLKPDTTTTGGDWGAVFRVDATDLGELQILHHDGLWGSSIWSTTARRARPIGSHRRSSDPVGGARATIPNGC